MSGEGWSEEARREVGGEGRSRNGCTASHGTKLSNLQLPFYFMANTPLCWEQPR